MSANDVARGQGVSLCCPHPDFLRPIEESAALRSAAHHAKVREMLETQSTKVCSDPDALLSCYCVASPRSVSSEQFTKTEGGPKEGAHQKGTGGEGQGGSEGKTDGCENRSSQRCQSPRKPLTRHKAPAPRHCSSIPKSGKSIKE